MPAQVVLTAIGGPLSGREFVFAERTCSIVGRDLDCVPRLPREDRTVSRHHCLLDVNPPDVRIRDFGSMNGTYLNGRRVGQREGPMSAEQGSEMTFPEHDLSDGDEVAVGETVFRVAIHTPTMCSGCGRELPDSERGRADIAPGAVLCSSCRSEVVEATLPPQKEAVVCSRCGKDVSEEAGRGRRGEFVCESCRKDPLEIVKLMLHSAMAGQEDALGIRGYSVEKELGRGGMGAVYLARREDTGERVALKVMLPRVAVQPRAKEAFMRETENTRVLRHRNIVQLLAHGCSGGTFFMTLEFCDGGSVDQLMAQRGGSLPVAEAVGITLQALDGLDYAHRALVPHVKRADGTMGSGIGITHRDIKPQNIFLSAKGGERLAKVGDYGLAKAFDNAGLSGHTRTGLVGGTPCFMPRQQVINFKYAKPEVDVWAMAASLYYMLTEAIPRDYPMGRDLWQVTLQTDPVPILRRDPSISGRLAAVIDEALLDRPALKYKTAAELRQAIESAI